jgi:DNA polymerase-3 subunit delta'
VIVLIATSLQKQLPTIRSRSQIVQFQPLATDQVARLLVDRGLVSDPALAQRLAELSEGSIQAALDMADPDLLEYRGELLDSLTAPDADSVALSKQLNAFIDDAGKEAPARRRRLRQVIGVAASYYRQIIRCLAGVAPDGDAELVQAAQRGAQQWPGDLGSAVTCLERCLDADVQVASNAHAVTFIDCWVDDLVECPRI